MGEPEGDDYNNRNMNNSSSSGGAHTNHKNNNINSNRRDHDERHEDPYMSGGESPRYNNGGSNHRGDMGGSGGGGGIIGSSALPPVFLGNLLSTYRPDAVTALFERPIQPSPKTMYHSIPVDRIDIKRGYCFVFLKDALTQADKDNVEGFVLDINGMEIPNVSMSLRAEFARGDGRVKKKEDERRQNIAPSQTLFVVNFQEETTREDDLRRLFDQFGELVRIDLIRNYAFVQFRSIAEATLAKEKTNGRKLDESVLTVEYVANRGSGGGGGGGGGGRGRPPSSSSYSDNRDRRPQGRGGGGGGYGGDDRPRRDDRNIGGGRRGGDDRDLRTDDRYRDRSDYDGGSSRGGGRSSAPYNDSYGGGNSSRYDDRRGGGGRVDSGPPAVRDRLSGRDTSPFRGGGPGSGSMMRSRSRSRSPVVGGRYRSSRSPPRAYRGGGSGSNLDQRRYSDDLHPEDSRGGSGRGPTGPLASDYRSGGPNTRGHSPPSSRRDLSPPPPPSMGAAPSSRGRGSASPPMDNYRGGGGGPDREHRGYRY